MRAPIGGNERRTLLLAALLLAPVVASSAHAQTGVTRTKRGDTTVVSTQGNGKWGAPHDAIEVLRVPGDTKETTFGAAYVLAATGEGGVVLADTKGSEGLIVRQFDANGKFVRKNKTEIDRRRSPVGLHCEIRRPRRRAPAGRRGSSSAPSPPRRHG